MLSELLPIATSATIRAAGYDVAGELLTVQLKNGEAWEYPNVTARTWEDFMSPRTDQVFASIEYASKATKRRVELSDSAETGGVFAERQLTRDFGERGTDERRRHDELARESERLNLPYVRHAEQLEDVRARLVRVVAEVAANADGGDLPEVAGLMLEEMALVRVVAVAASASDAVDAQIEELRAEYQAGAGGRAKLARRNVLDQQDTLRAYALLASLNASIDNPGTIDHVTLGKSYAHMSLEQATRARMQNWRAERTTLRASLGLPDDPNGGDTRPSWLRGETVESASAVAD